MLHHSSAQENTVGVKRRSWVYGTATHLKRHSKNSQEGLQHSDSLPCLFSANSRYVLMVTRNSQLMAPNIVLIFYNFTTSHLCTHLMECNPPFTLCVFYVLSSHVYIFQWTSLLVQRISFGDSQSTLSTLLTFACTSVIHGRSVQLGELPLAFPVWLLRPHPSAINSLSFLSRLCF